MTNLEEYGEVFSALRQTTPHWHAYTRHAFVRGLGDGSLPKESFYHYLKQDYVFLIHFSRAWALAVAKANSLDEIKACASTVNGLANGEMQYHVETCGKLGIPEDELFKTVEANENLAYTRFVLEAGYSGDFVSLLATLAPCVFGYGEIGLMLADDKTSDTYQDWIETYAGKDYQDVCINAGQLLDQAVINRFGKNYTQLPIWNKLISQFNIATRLEVDFWNMGLRGPCANPIAEPNGT
ncbi:thiaminase II [Lentilitoribacter sp. EG35]|jgi:thiaminase/transcriptional activator TenA|uniref:thiaminase II n=1 Tax=Lentilitoribacter sp. EG35 TaxID=3234192 RepID=UPI003460B3C4